MCPLLQVFDMNISLQFYCETLQFKVHQSAGEEGAAPDWVWLKWNNIDLMMNTAYEAAHRPPQPDAARSRTHGDVTLYFGCPDVDGAYRDLSAKGLSLQPPKVAPYGMKQMYCYDPDGYQLCFQWEAQYVPE